MSYSGVADERLVHGVRELGRLLQRELGGVTRSG